MKYTICSDTGLACWMLPSRDTFQGVAGEIYSGSFVQRHPCRETQWRIQYLFPVHMYDVIPLHVTFLLQEKRNLTAKRQELND